MSRASWSWELGSVDANRDHVILSHDDSELPVAIVGPAVERVFPVEFPLALQGGASDPALAKIAEDVRRELDVYLVELNEPDPWAYAIYHCGTISNVYPPVHWAFHRVDTAGEGARHELV